MTHSVTPILSASTTYTPGAIVCNHWGHEQTNVEFYVIVDRTTDFVTILELQKISGPMSQGMRTTEDPTVCIKDGAKPIRRKIKRNGSGVEQGFSLRDSMSGGWAKLWDGTTQYATHYA